jgi:nicotinate dehydrogenase subunit B
VLRFRRCHNSSTTSAKRLPHEGHGWDPKAPACVIRCKAGLDSSGNISGWYYHAKGFSGWDVNFNAAEPRDTLVGQLTGFAKADAHNFGSPGESYVFANSVKFWESVPTFLAKASPLRSSHMRAPQEPQVHFAHECFIYEVAQAAGIDPIVLRLKHLQDPREIAVLEAVAKLANWQPRTSPAPQQRGNALSENFAPPSAVMSPPWWKSKSRATPVASGRAGCLSRTTVA